MSRAKDLPRSAGSGRNLKAIFLFAALTWCALLCHAASAQQATAQDYEGTFGGTYRANQGLTRVVIVIEALSDSEVGARYVFYPDNSNRAVPNGEFLLQGAVDAKTGKLVLVGKEWVVHPKDYVMVDVACTLASDRKTLTGQVYLPQDKTTKFEFKAARWSRTPP